MSKSSTMRFSCPPNWSGVEFSAVLGTIGETVWSMRFFYDNNNRVQVARSLSKDSVKIDVVVLDGSVLVISSCNEFLSKGEKSSKAFPCQLHSSYPVTGYVTVHHNCASSIKKEAVAQTEDNFYLPQLAKDLLYLVNNPDSYSDATLVCNTSKLPVHRNILSARSPVFAAMFKTQMQEGRDGVINIVDLEPNVVQAMLKYIYSGKTDHLTCSLAGDLLFAADKYQLEELKMICVEELKASMAANNVFRSVVLGDLHDKSLKEHAVGFICKYKNFSALEQTEAWQSLLMERPSLAVEVATTVIKYLQN